MATVVSGEIQEGVSIRALARIFNVSPPVLYELARKNELPGCRRLGAKRFVVHVATFRKWLESGGRGE